MVKRKIKTMTKNGKTAFKYIDSMVFGPEHVFNFL